MLVLRMVIGLILNFPYGFKGSCYRLNEKEDYSLTLFRTSSPLLGKKKPYACRKQR